MLGEIPRGRGERAGSRAEIRTRHDHSVQYALERKQAADALLAPGSTESMDPTIEQRLKLVASSSSPTKAPSAKPKAARCWHTYLHTCLHTCLCACLRAYLPTCLHMCLNIRSTDVFSRNNGYSQWQNYSVGVNQGRIKPRRSDTAQSLNELPSQYISSKMTKFSYNNAHTEPCTCTHARTACTYAHGMHARMHTHMCAPAHTQTDTSTSPMQRAGSRRQSRRLSANFSRRTSNAVRGDGRRLPTLLHVETTCTSTCCRYYLCVSTGFRANVTLSQRCPFAKTDLVASLSFWPLYLWCQYSRYASRS